jgi:hypothetical protein
MLSRHSAMDVMPQLSAPALNLSALPSVSIEAWAVDGLLRPISLETNDSFSGYFTGVDGASLAGVVGGTPGPVASFSPVVGQYFDQDFLGDMGAVLNNFVESGQLWAMLFGIVIGYMIRNLTAY